jgi:hypothetical protein
MKTNVTLKIDAGLLREARILAAEALFPGLFRHTNLTIQPTPARGRCQPRSAVQSQHEPF